MVILVGKSSERCRELIDGGMEPFEAVHIAMAEEYTSTPKWPIMKVALITDEKTGKETYRFTHTGTGKITYVDKSK